MWESSKHSHPRRGLGFMDEAAEDISCNIMPEPLPAPYIPPLSPPRRLLSPIQSTHRHEILFFFFVPAMTIFFFFCWRGVGGEDCRLCCCGQPCGCMRKETWVSFTHECARARQNIESEPLWQSRPFLCLWWCEHVHSAVGWRKQPTWLSGL